LVKPKKRGQGGLIAVLILLALAVVAAVIYMRR
jgi:flagellin-like protein